MGAETDYRRYMNATKQEAEKQFTADQSQSAYEDGNSYSGCIGVLPHGVNWVSKVFPSPLDAERHITDNHEKWEQAMGVEFADDAGDTCGFSIGGWCSS
jgi:hypothetical protein